MKPVLNRRITTFFDLYEFYDQEPDDDHGAGFLQMWRLSPFFLPSIDGDDISGAYNRLLARFFTTPFGMLDERQIHLNVFRIIRDFLPNLRRRIDTLEDIYDEDLANLQARTARTAQAQASGNSNVADTGYENQAQTPNTAASPTAPILDMISAQRNRNLNQAVTDARINNTSETVLGDLSTAYHVKLDAIVDGLWDEFIKRFDKLFVHLYSGIYDYMYRNELNEEGGN